MKTREFLSKIYEGYPDGFLTITMLPDRKILGLRKIILKGGFRGSEQDIYASIVCTLILI